MGTPEGGIISHLLANMALDGMERLVGAEHLAQASVSTYEVDRGAIRDGRVVSPVAGSRRTTTLVLPPARGPDQDRLAHRSEFGPDGDRRDPPKILWATSTEIRVFCKPLIPQKRGFDDSVG
jgi:hypothetical protein